MKNYSDQIKSPKWQMKRNEILNLRGYKCEVCGNTELQLHLEHGIEVLLKNDSINKIIEADIKNEILF